MTVATSWAVAAPALAYVSLGCKWATGLFPSILYEFNSVTSTNQTAFLSGRNNWNGHTNPDTYLASGIGDVNIEVYDKTDSSVGWTALWSYGCSSGVFSSHEGALTFNDYHMPSATYAKAVVATHEIGHSYGLGHQSMSCSSTPRVMEQGSEKWSQNGNCTPNPPWTDDVNGWEAVNQ